jgi:ABC-type protease/lipase transport system fused ATPase/permease subunit
MTDFGRRQEALPPANFDEIDVSHLQVAIAALRILAERARLRLAEVNSFVAGAMEAIRRRVFSGRIRSNAEYEESRSEISTFLSSCRRIFWTLAIFSGLSNLLMLNGSFFMLQVYDRVLPGRSIPTLVALLALVTMLYLLQGGLDLVRDRICVRIGRYLDERLGVRVYDTLVRLPLKTRGDGDGLQPIRDLDQVRSFLSSGGPTALFDLPWIPVYLGICFLFHFWIGVTALLGGVFLVGLTILTEARTRGPTKAFSRHAVLRNALAAEGRRNAEVLQAMGMRRQAALRWQEANQKYLAAHESSSDVASGLGGLSKVFRSLLQSLVLAVGAYLVINQEATGGIIIAGSILTARALAPVDVAIANWKGFVAARQSGERLDQLLKLLPSREQPLALPPSTGALVVKTSTSQLPVLRKRFCLTCRSQCEAARRSASSARAVPANPRSRGRWSGSGRMCGAKSNSITPCSSIGRPRRWVSILAICPRTSNCSTAA